MERTIWNSPVVRNTIKHIREPIASMSTKASLLNNQVRKGLYPMPDWPPFESNTRSDVFDITSPFELQLKIISYLSSFSGLTNFIRPISLYFHFSDMIFHRIPQASSQISNDSSLVTQF